MAIRLLDFFSAIFKVIAFVCVVIFVYLLAINPLIFLIMGESFPFLHAIHYIILSLSMALLSFFLGKLLKYWLDYAIWVKYGRSKKNYFKNGFRW